MRSDIGYPLALLRDIEEPRRSNIGRSRDYLQNVMYALKIYRRILLRTFDDFTEYISRIKQFFLQDRRDLITLGHNVVCDMIPCRIHRRFELGKILRFDDPGLIHEHVQAALDRSLDPIDLALITT